VLGAGLLFLRIFPYIIRLVFRLGQKKWSPVFYASFIQVGRSGGNEQFLILFIIFALSIGIFNANAARTINGNMEDRIRYGAGADIAVMAHWQSTEVIATTMEAVLAKAREAVPKPILYTEPSFIPFTQLSGIQATTKVFKKDGAKALLAGESANNVQVMGIISDEFGKIAWYRNGLLPHHINEYLNLMTENPTAFLVSSSLKEKFKIKEGDTISVAWGTNQSIEGTVYAFIDYWPSFNPSTGKSPYLIVANLSYIHERAPIEPYEVWMSKKPDASSTQIYNDIENKKLELDYIKNPALDIVEKKNDPMLQATNGALTLGFIASMLISTIGFLIYWILSIRKRTLHFAIFRAMGLTVKKVIGMLVCEQVMISGVAIFMGIIIGGITSNLFVPLLQMSFSPSEQVPPFKVVAYSGDYIKIYIITAIMLLIGFVTLGTLISKIKIDQAIKLGED
jgi:putative ABC transport system permease protein